jgi:hypothetical protein
VFSRVDICAYIEDDEKFHCAEFLMSDFGDFVPTVKLSKFWVNEQITRSNPGPILGPKDYTNISATINEVSNEYFIAFQEILRNENFNKRIY